MGGGPLGAAAALCAAIGLAPARACAEDPIFGRDTLHGLVEIGAAAADGERSWTDGGFGKAAISGGGGHDWDGRLAVRQAVMEWRPSFGFAVNGLVSAQWQHDAEERLDLDEAYLQLRAPPSRLGALTGRVGVFYPPVSLEHEGVGWTPPDLLTASAIGSWIGEEVKVGGAEATFRRAFGDHELTATAGAFGWNDTSGTLLTFRGWALHGLRAGVRSAFPLPPLSPFMQGRQAAETDPTWEIDHRVGFYGRLAWRPPAPVVVEAFHYDNRGDRTSVRDGQWAWETRFTTLAVRWEPSADLRIQAQGLTGRTWMGFATPDVWADVGFRSAYVSVRRDFGGAVATARLDWFETEDHTFQAVDDNDETGWAGTIGLRRPIAQHVDLLVEAQHIRSKRPSRALAQEAPIQDQNVVQTAVRFRF